MNKLLSEVPIGFGMHLAQNLDAMTTFANLDKKEKEEVVSHAKNISSKEEMNSLWQPSHCLV